MALIASSLWNVLSMHGGNVFRKMCNIKLTMQIFSCWSRESVLGSWSLYSKWCTVYIRTICFRLLNLQHLIVYSVALYMCGIHPLKNMQSCVGASWN